MNVVGKTCVQAVLRHEYTMRSTTISVKYVHTPPCSDGGYSLKFRILNLDMFRYEVRALKGGVRYETGVVPGLCCVETVISNLGMDFTTLPSLLYLVPEVVS